MPTSLAQWWISSLSAMLMYYASPASPVSVAQAGVCTGLPAPLRSNRHPHLGTSPWDLLCSVIVPQNHNPDLAFL